MLKMMMMMMVIMMMMVLTMIITWCDMTRMEARAAMAMVRRRSNFQLREEELESSFDSSLLEAFLFW